MNRKPSTRRRILSPAASGPRARFTAAGCALAGLVMLLLAGGCVRTDGRRASQNAARVQRYFDFWANQGDVRAAEELIATNVVLRHPHATVSGWEVYKQSMTSFRAAFPDLHFAVGDLVAQRDRVLARWTMTGTQRGDYLGRAASGRSVKVSGMSLFRIDRGRIVEIWVNMDRLGFLEQLGALPAMNAGPVNRYFELRLYTVTSNKMDAVLERFRETVGPVRRRHGITTLGYWMAPGTTNGGTFAYLLAAPSREELQQREKAFGADPQFKEGYAANSREHGRTVEKIVSVPLTADASAGPDFAVAAGARAFDLRIYSVLPGKLDAFRARWRDYAVPIYARHGLQSVGWWVAADKDADGREQFVCLLAGRSVEAIQKSIGEFHRDAEWLRIERETEQAGKLRGGVVAFKLTPVDFPTPK